MGKRTNTATWNEKYNRWQINVQKDGYRRSFYSSAPGRTGQREANAKADAWLDDGISPTGERLEAAYNQYRQECKENMSTTEYNHVDSVGRVWIIPNLGKRKITELNDGDVQKMLDKAAAMGRSKKTIQDINGILNKFLKWCRRNKKTTYRPDDVHIPASARLKGKTVLQPDDFCTLFSTDTALYKGKRQKDEYIHAYRFQVLTGLRPGELRGLRVKDIQGGVVYVQRSVNVYGETTQGKNENAVRSFVLSDLARCELALQLQEHPSESGYVFPLPSPTAYRERWQKYCASNGMTKTTPYELRHTFVSVVKTLPVGEVKPLVGHSESMDTFGIYGHALQGEDTETAEKINRLFRKLLTDQPKDKPAQAPNKTE